MDKLVITHFSPVRYNYNLQSHIYVCITTYQPDTKSNPTLNLLLNRPTYPDKFIQDMLLHRLCDFRL